MAHISLTEAKAWTESTKVGNNFDALDTSLEDQISAQIIERLASRFTTTATWLTTTTTPKLVRTIISMYYVAWIYDRQYSTDEDTSAYAALLRTMADANIEGLLSGVINLPEIPSADVFGEPVFFPNDLSSSLEATVDFPNDGPPSFTMGRVF